MVVPLSANHDMTSMLLVHIKEYKPLLRSLVDRALDSEMYMQLNM